MLDPPDGRRIAYRRSERQGPGVVFLGGFRSDMTGAKAHFLEAWARARGQAYLRFDYTGHGASSGDFLACGSATGRTTPATRSAADRRPAGPRRLQHGRLDRAILAGWMPARIAGLVGVAAAPDFTEDAMWAAFDETQRRRLLAEGRIELASEYDEAPYPITRRLIEDGRQNLVLRAPPTSPSRSASCTAPPTATSTSPSPSKLLAHATGPDIRLTLVKDADHRFSAPENLELLAETIEAIL